MGLIRSARVGTAAVASAGLVLPLLILELLNRDLDGNFPILLFGVLWVLPFAFFLLVARSMRPSPHTRRRRLVQRVITGVCLLGLVLLWGAIVLDQMPCFLGVPNCD